MAMQNWLQLGIMSGVLVNVIITAFFYGKLVQKVNDHDKRIDGLEAIHPRREGKHV